MSPRGFQFDPNRCTGCQACELGCTIENSLPWGTSWRRVSTFNPDHRLPEAPRQHLSLACNHCLDAPCLRHCPALAIRRSSATDAVLIDPERCIGCGYCSWACPWDALQYDSRSAVMTKCTLCDHRLQTGLEPACVTACPTGCLDYGEVDSTQAIAAPPGFPEADVGPLVRFTELNTDRTAPAARSWPGEPSSTITAATRTTGSRRQFGLASEWPLIAFSLAFACLVAGHARLLADDGPRNPLAFLAVALATMALSSLHLGRKWRAWRAVLNLRRSWLSREVAAFSGFVGLAALWHLDPAAGDRALGIGALAVGLLGLHAVDRVYDLAVGEATRRPHSAEVLWTGSLFIALLLRAPIFAGLVLGLKLVLYLRRRGRTAVRSLKPVLGTFILRPALSAIGFALWLSGSPEGTALGLAAIALAELLDRCEFYLELEFGGPGRQMTLDLLAMAATEP